MAPRAIRVLVVEDDEDDYLLTRMVLKDTSSTTFELTWVRCLQDAMAALTHRHDVWLVDYQLGAHTGLEVLGAAIAGGFTGPIIMLTSHGDQRIAVQAMKAGAADYLVKDEITAQLMARVIVHSIERVETVEAQRHAEAALRKSEVQYRQIVEETTDGIIKADLDGRLVFVNRRFAAMLGYAPGEMVGAPVADFVSRPARLTTTAALLDRAHGVQAAVDSTFRHRNGSDIWCNIAGTPLHDADGKHIGSLGVVRDETERRKLQSQLMISDRMASVGTLAAGVAHEINNPLAAVIGNLDHVGECIAAKVTDGAVRAELGEPLADAIEGAHRIRSIVRDLRLFSRSPTEEPKGAVDIKTTLESSLRMASNEIRHRARLVRDYADVPGVEANEARLGQVFLNLIVNAAQSMPQGRAEQNEIRVSTRHEGDFAIVEVRDTGPGMTPEVMSRIFDAFFTTKAAGAGTGLGLAICQRLVGDMHGTLTVTSEVGVGTTFRISLPVARSGSPVAAKTAPTPAVVLGRRGRVLVVDDEMLVIRSIERTLAKEHDVVALVAAKDALALCRRGETFDLILCDMMMPDMTGMQLHRELTRIAPAQAERMLFLTGGAFTDEARQFLAETSNEQLDKPFTAANLRAIVRRYLQP